ncbi:cyclic lactone autoinducer peptide [Wukongibacter sp. M2B1]
MLTFIALRGVSTMCFWATYEPDIPESLKRDL